MPTPVILSLGDFKSALVGHFAPGTWVVEYHDCTHLSAEPEETYVTLGQVEIEEVTPKGTAFFYFRPTPCQSNHQQGAEQPSEGIKYLESLIEEAWTTGNVGGSKNPADVARYILDLIKESAVRLGLIRLAFEIDDPDFDQRNFAVIILDTNALRSGAVRHLKEQFEAVQLWAIIPLVSLKSNG
jgi:hypothetical protein